MEFNGQNRKKLRGIRTCSFFADVTHQTLIVPHNDGS